MFAFALPPAGPFLSNPPRMATEHIDVRYVAGLARLELTDGECAVFQRQLEAILGHVESLAALDVSGIEPTSYPAPVYDVMREDEPRESLPAGAVLANAPDQAQEQIRVPKVIADA
jgi:aspartyl-tRNA(Asn)/glutamyl-tRNA(Gln) amidotransferase subunit C